MESRKYLLQKQIIEALNANDSDLYYLLKSQWAHRFGVESLEELKSLDLDQVNQIPTDQDNKKINQSQDNVIENDEVIQIKDSDKEEKEKINNNKEVIKTNDVENKESFEIKSYGIEDNDSYASKASEYRNQTQTNVEALIPLPPRPKYGYLSKWLLR